MYISNRHAVIPDSCCYMYISKFCSDMQLSQTVVETHTFQNSAQTCNYPRQLLKHVHFKILIRNAIIPDSCWNMYISKFCSDMQLSQTVVETCTFQNSDQKCTYPRQLLKYVHFKILIRNAIIPDSCWNMYISKFWSEMQLSQTVVETCTFQNSDQKCIYPRQLLKYVHFKILIRNALIPDSCWNMYISKFWLEMHLSQTVVETCTFQNSAQTCNYPRQLLKYVHFKILLRHAIIPDSCWNMYISKFWLEMHLSQTVVETRTFQISDQTCSYPRQLL